MVYPTLLPLIRTARLPVVHWTDAPADLNGLLHFAERRNLFSARVPSHFKRSLLHRQSQHCSYIGSRFDYYCGFCLPTTPAVNRSSEMFKVTKTVTVGPSSVFMALQPLFWPWSLPYYHLLTKVFSVPCCRLPLLYQEQICSIPSNITLPPNCMTASFPTHSNYFWAGSRFVIGSRTTLSWKSLPNFLNAKYWTIGAMLQLMLRVTAYIVLYLGYCMIRHVVGPCHHGMARPQVADRGTASDKEGSCE